MLISFKQFGKLSRFRKCTEAEKEKYQELNYEKFNEHSNNWHKEQLESQQYSNNRSNITMNTQNPIIVKFIMNNTFSINCFDQIGAFLKFREIDNLRYITSIFFQRKSKIPGL
jgi:hypothetical protein